MGAVSEKSETALFCHLGLLASRRHLIGLAQTITELPSPALSPQISRHLHSYPAGIPHTGSEESRTLSTLSDALEADHFYARGTHQERLPIVWFLPVVWGGGVFFNA